MGCMCCSLSSFISICLNAFERATVCTVCAVLTFCLLFTILAVMAIGVGIGFHYCFVTQSVDIMAKAAKLTAGAEEGPTGTGTGTGTGDTRRGLSAMRSNVMRAVEAGVQRRRLFRRDVDHMQSLSNNQAVNSTINQTALSLNEHLSLRNLSKFASH